MRTNVIVFQERRKRIYNIIQNHGLISFKELVEKSKFSLAEVIFHIIALKKIEENPVYILWKEKFVLSASKRRAEQRDLTESFNEFMYGCPNPMHVFGVGYVDTRTRYGKRFLDP